MAIQLTSDECQAIMSLYRQFEFPNYDHNCRSEEDWLKHPERRKALYTARTKILSAEAKTPEAVAVPQAPASVAAPQKPAVIAPAGTTAQRLDRDNLVTGPIERTEETPAPVVSLSSMPETAPAAAPAAAETPKEPVKAEAPKPEAAKTEAPKPEVKKHDQFSQKRR